VTFLNNKYTKIYYQIIDRAKSRPKPSEYTEKHHIIPKCAGGKETVVLTFKEHWVCHHLLLKMVTGKLLGKMFYAFMKIGQISPKQKEKRIVNSKMFERIKISNIVSCSGKNSPLYKKKRKPFTEETKCKMGKWQIGRKISEESKEKNRQKHLGKKVSEETKEKISKTLKGRISPNKGKKFSEETKRRMSLAHLGKKNPKMEIKNA
jgi:hypothetical protein